jgi:hypothetical protein
MKFFKIVEKSLPRSVRGADYITVGIVFSKNDEKMTKFNNKQIFQKMSKHFQKVACTSSMCT